MALDPIVCRPDPKGPTPLKPREVEADTLLSALSDDETAALNLAKVGAKRKDQLYLEHRASFVEGNPKLTRLFNAAGLDMRAVFDRATA